MNKDLHNIDSVFNSSYQKYEDSPSSGVWENLAAELDKKESEEYRKRFVGWRRVAIILALLISGFMLYEVTTTKPISGLFQKDEPVSKEEKSKDSISDATSSGLAPEQAESQKSSFLENLNRNEVLNKTDLSQEASETEQLPSETNTIDDIFTSNSKKDSRDQSFQPLINLIKKSVTKTLVSNKGDNQNEQTGNFVISQQVVAIDSNRVQERNTYAFLKTPSIQGGSFLNLLNENSSPHIIHPDLLYYPAITKTKPKKTKPNSSWTLTAFTSKDWGQYKLEKDDAGNAGNPTNEIEEIGKREKHEPSFSAGMYLAKQFSKNLGIKTGLVYSNTAIVIGPQQLYASQTSDGGIAYKYITSSGYGYFKPAFSQTPSIGDSIYSKEAQHNLQTISVPVMISYKIIDKKKISITPSAGVSANIITKAFLTTEIENAQNKEIETIDRLNGVNKFYPGFIADVNLQYIINSKLSVNLLPTFKYAIVPATKGNAVKTYPYSYGIGAGLTFKL